MTVPDYSVLKEDVENRIPHIFSAFRQEAARHGVHDQVAELCEEYMKITYVAGMEDPEK